MQALLQGMKNLRAAAQSLGEARRADRHHHEFLEIDRIVGMGAAVQDVHHRHRQRHRPLPADRAVERHALRRGSGLRRGEADAENRIGAEPGLVLGTVELDHRGIDRRLVLGRHAFDARRDLAVHRGDRLRHAFAEPAALVAVALLDRLVRPGRGAGGDGGPAIAPVREPDLDLDRRVAAAIENLAAVDVGNGGHSLRPRCENRVERPYGSQAAYRPADALATFHGRARNGPGQRVFQEGNAGPSAL